MLIGQYHAKEIPYSYAQHRPQVDRADDVRETRAAMPAAVQWEIAAGTLSSQRWESYLTRYPWQVELSPAAKLLSYQVGYVSAERTSAPLTADLAAYAQQLLQPQPKAVPAHLDLHLSGDYGRKRLVRIEPFAEAETMAAF